MPKEKTQLEELRALAKKEEKKKSQWYDLNPVLGNQWAMFYVLIGAR